MQVGGEGAGRRTATARTGGAKVTTRRNPKRSEAAVELFVNTVASMSGPMSATPDSVTASCSTRMGEKVSRRSSSGSSPETPMATAASPSAARQIAPCARRSAAVAALFAGYGQEYQALSAQAAVTTRWISFMGCGVRVGLLHR